MFGTFPPVLFFVLLAILFVAGIALLLWAPSKEDSYELTPEEHALLMRPPESRSAFPPADTFLPSTSSRSATELWIDSDPSGSRVLIDYEVAGRTPFYSDRLSSGWYLLSLEHEGYASEDTLLYLTAGRSTEIVLDLTPSQSSPPPNPAETRSPRPGTGARPQRATPPTATEAGRRNTGTIQVDATPAGATVRLDGDAAGVTPLRVAGVAPGRHTLSFDLAGYEPHTMSIDVRPGETAYVTAALEQQAGTLSVRVSPWGAIYVDGALRARDTDLRYEMALSPGSHRVRVVHPKLGAREQEVQIRPGQATTLVFDLNRRTP